MLSISNVELPSGKRLQFAIEKMAQLKYSGFIYSYKMVDLSIVFRKRLPGRVYMLIIFIAANLSIQIYPGFCGLWATNGHMLFSLNYPAW